MYEIMKQWIKIIKHDHAIQIVDQSHRSREFGYNGEFIAKNGVILKSSAYPENAGHTIYVWGYNKEKDDTLIKFYQHGDDLERAIEAIEEFNMVFESPEYCSLYLKLDIPKEMFEI